jgi:hypothetical protein
MGVGRLGASIGWVGGGGVSRAGGARAGFAGASRRVVCSLSWALG